jgi:hypothetical protein
MGTYLPKLNFMLDCTIISILDPKHRVFLDFLEALRAIFERLYMLSETFLTLLVFLTFLRILTT